MRIGSVVKAFGMFGVVLDFRYKKGNHSEALVQWEQGKAWAYQGVLELIVE
jgi:hypothetical protein